MTGTKNRGIAVVLGIATSLLLTPAFCDAKKTKLVFAGRYVQAKFSGQSLVNAVKEYERLHPDIDIEYIGENDHHVYRQKLLAMTAAGRTPDVMHLDQPYLYDFAERGLLMPIPANVAHRVRPKFYPTVYNTMVYKGKVYGFGTENHCSGIIYSKKVLKEAGIGSVPDTWDGLAALATKLTVTNGNTVKRYGFCADLGSHMLTGLYGAMVTANGGKFIRDNKTAFNGKQGLDAIKDLRSWFTERKTATQSWWDIPTERIALSWNYAWINSAAIQLKFKDRTSDYFGVADVPGGPGGRKSAFYTWGMAVAQGSRYKKEALEFAEWLTTRPAAPNNMTWVGTSISMGSLPACPADLGKGNYEVFREWFEGFARNMDYCWDRTNLADQNKMELALYDAIYPAIMGGKATPESAINNAARSLDAILARQRNRN